MEITIYSTPTCYKCQSIKKILTDKGINFVDKDATDNYEEVKDLDVQSAPIVIVKREDKAQSCVYDFDGFVKFMQDENLV